MSHGKQFTMYSSVTGPNGWKVASVLQELDLTYETIFLNIDAGEHKAPEFTKYNPNGRIPAIIDHYNNDFVLWESNAIILYLIDKYDPSHKISVSDSREKHLLNQWLFFQASGQGPYYGQLAWFATYHPEPVPSAIERYKNEAARVLGVLEDVLSKNEWLVGNKCTVADISFIAWNRAAFRSFFRDDAVTAQERFPSVWKWHNAVINRPALQELVAVQQSLRDAQIKLREAQKK